MKVRRIIAGGVLALVALAVAGCSSGSDTKGSANDRIHAAAGSSSKDDTVDLEGRAAEVCSLYNTRDVNAFFKGDAKISHSDPTNCIRTVGSNQMTVSVWHGQTRGSYDKYVAARTDAKKLAGVGEGADYSADSQALQFVKGDVVVTVSVKGNNLNTKALQTFLVAQAKYAATKV